MTIAMRLYIPNLGSECNRYYLNSLLWGLVTSRKCKLNCVSKCVGTNMRNAE